MEKGRPGYDTSLKETLYSNIFHIFVFVSSGKLLIEKHLLSNKWLCTYLWQKSNSTNLSPKFSKLMPLILWPLWFPKLYIYWWLTSLGPIRFRAGAVTGLAEMELVCLRGGRGFTYVQWKQFELGYLIFRAGQCKMQAMAMQKKQTRWRQRPKIHSLEHLTYDFHYLNPRYCSNFLDEDVVRRSKAVAIKSDPKCVSKHVLFRYCIAATLRWTGMVPG